VILIAVKGGGGGPLRQKERAAGCSMKKARPSAWKRNMPKTRREARSDKRFSIRNHCP
jgi:hypothetical protein